MESQNLRIILISPLPPPSGGIATWTEQYFEWTTRNNINIDIVNTAVTGKRAQQINSKRVMLDELIRTGSIITELRRKIFLLKPQVIHLNTPCGRFGIIRDFLCAKLVVNHEIKLVVHYRCNLRDQISSNIISKYFLKKISNIASVNIVLNKNSMEYLKSEIKENCVRIPNFIDNSFNLTKTKEINKDIQIVSFVGHIQISKGVLEIIDVARKMPDISFKLAGPVASEIKKIKKPKNLFLLGSLTKNEIKELLSQSDLFLFPSHTEGFANVMLEAMSMGLPIISTPVGANSEMIEKKGGITVDIGNSNEIVKAIENLIDFRIRSDMSNWNISKVKNNYTTDIVMRKLICLYLNIINY